MNDNTAIAIVVVAMCGILPATIFAGSCGQNASSNNTDPAAVKICSPYPAFSSFNKDGVVYAVCVQPDAGLVAKRIR